jgi:uncharacterized protein (TIGR03435 family)
MLRDIARKLGLGMLAGMVAWAALAASSLGQTNAMVADSSRAAGAVAEPPIQFDVVSIRQSKADRKGPRVRSMPADGDGMTFTNQPMLVMILVASDFNTIALTQGLPEWTMSDRYDMTVKVTGVDVAVYHTLSLAQRLLMLRRALEDRIKLKTHLELRPEPVYDLVVAKGGPKMKAATPGETYPNEGKAGVGQSILFTPPGRLVGQGATMAELASRMSDLGDYSIGHQVFDKTGLTGRYDFTLEWTPDMNGAGDSDGPTLFTAVPEQLGLKLDAAKEPVQCLIIDHAERPGEN